MRMKKFSKFFMSMLAMCSIAACSNDELGNEPVVDPGASTDAVYMNVTVQLPTGPGTRSKTDDPDDDYGTSTDGTEVGKNYENDVKRVLLVLAKTADNGTENEVIASALNEEKSLTISGSTAKSIHRIDKTSLSRYYQNDGTLTNNKIKVFVFCNPTEQLQTAITKPGWIDEKAKVTEDPDGIKNSTIEDADKIWGGSDHKGGFLMSTARSGKDIIKTIPASLLIWDKHDKPTNPFDLSGENIYPDNPANNIDNSNPTDTDLGNDIKVERSVARFDFKDGSGNKENPNTYDVVKEIKKVDGKDVEGPTTIQVKLFKMALVNMSKEFYYLRRISNNGLNENATICGAETPTNYVVDTDAEAKQKSLDSFNYGDHFNFCLGKGLGKDWIIDEKAREQWNSVKISAVIDNENNKDNKNGDYHIWRYVTENTIPAPAGGLLPQRHGISTGIVFKGKMIATNDADPLLQKVLNGGEYETGKEVTGVSENDPILYAYGTKLFVRWKQVREYAIEKETDDPTFYKIVFGTPNNKPSKDVYSDATDSPDYLWDKWYNRTEGTSDADAKTLLKNFKKAATDALFTLYQSSIDDEGKAGYYCYYYYWNRHNDNEKPSEMGPMEFAVVRNNVYKLAVTKISQLGHPRISENDPDPEDPEKPDESSKIYITLSVKVLPWVVRVNNIEF